MVFEVGLDRFYLFPLFGILETVERSHIFEISSLSITHSDVVFLETDERFTDGDIICYRNPQHGASLQKKKQMPFMRYGALIGRSTGGNVIFCLMVRENNLAEDFVRKFQLFQAEAAILANSNPSENFVFEGRWKDGNQEASVKEEARKKMPQLRLFPFLDAGLLVVLLFLANMWFPVIESGRLFVDEMTNRFEAIKADCRSGHRSSETTLRSAKAASRLE